MVTSPWPTASVASVLFVIDAAHSVEKDHLSQWLTKMKPADFAGEVADVVVRIGRDPENIDSSPLALLAQLPGDTLVIPVRVMWGSSVDSKGASPRLMDLLRGNPRRPNASKAARLLRRHPKKAICLAGAAATIDQLREQMTPRAGLEPDERLAEFVAGRAGLALDIAERGQRGTRYKVPRRVAANLTASPEYQAALAKVSAETSEPIEELEEDAADIMRELIAIPRTFWQDFLAAFNRKMIGMGYESEFVVDPESLQRFRTIVRENPSALLWTHKTHVDGFAVYSMLFENDFPVPHVLGGVNMAFAGLGFVARRSGAIFIRRSFQDNLLYKMILRQYIGYLLAKRFPLTWAFEGTRSRVGKLMPPRYGLLKYVIEAAHTTGTKNLHFIPVAINYDLIGDVRDYAREQAGAVKQPESLRWFLGYLRGLRQPLGRIYVDFGEPVVLEDAPSAEDALQLKKIAFQVGVEVNRVTPITLASIVTTILLGAAPQALTREELRSEVQRVILWARERNIRVTDSFDNDNAEALGELAQVLVSNGLITRYDDGPDVVYAITPTQHGVASYYRNTTVHHFVSKAIAEMAMRYAARRDGNGTERFWREAERLRDMFKFEFFYAPSEQFKAELRGELSRYDEQWEAKLEADSDYANEFLEKFTPLMAHATLLVFVEAYRVVAHVLARLDDEESLSEKDCVSRSLAYGRQAYLQRTISSEASIGKLVFANGYQYASHLGLTQGGDPEVGVKRKALSQKLRRLARRIERIRTMAMPGASGL